MLEFRKIFEEPAVKIPYRNENKDKKKYQRLELTKDKKNFADNIRMVYGVEKFSRHEHDYFG